MSPTLNYTTKISVGQTIGEIQELLASHDADRIVVAYTARQPTSVSFTLVADGQVRAFTLPVDIAGMAAALAQQSKDGKLSGISKATASSPEHAARVAWRVVKDWLAAQLTLVQARMATLEQVMLPYLVVDGETTLYEAWRQNDQRAIGGGA